MRMACLRASALAAIVIVGVVGTARGAVLISTLGQLEDSNINVTSTIDRYAVDFRTGDSATRITELKLRTIATLGTYGLSAQILTERIGLPGSLVNAFDGTASVSTDMTATFTDPGINLSANTNYWLVVYL